MENSLHGRKEGQTIALNDIGWLHLRLSRQLLFAAYKRNRNTGSFIMIDEFTHATVAAGMIL